MRKSIVTTVLALLVIAPLAIAAPALAANELVFNADTTIDLVSPDVDITILNGSIVDSMVTYPGSIKFTISSGGNITVRSNDRKALSHNSSVLPMRYTCGSSYSQMSATAGAGASNHTFTITVSSNTCTAAGGSTGGTTGGTTGGSTTPPADTTAPAGTPTTETTSFSETTPDGTQVTDVTTVTTVNGVTTKRAVETTITPVGTPTDSQTVNLSTAAVSNVKEVTLGLSSNVLQEMVNAYGTGDITVNISSDTATTQQTSNLGTGQFMVGTSVFSVNITAGNTSVTNFENPLTLTFDVSNIVDQSNLTVAWYDSANNQWVDLGGTITNNILTITVNHLTVFAVLSGQATGPTTPATAESGKATLAQMTADAEMVILSGSDIDALISYSGRTKDVDAQEQTMEKYTNKLIEGVEGLTTENTYAINNFIIYGTPTTKILGEGERAGVVNSFKSAFGRLPTTVEDWNDVIKIGNGRWPTQRSEAAENNATINFKKIYLRDPDMLSNQNDNAAVTVMAYGLRPADRNLDSERAAIKIFKAIYGYNPEKATAWDAVRAIAYSGATR